MGILCGSALAIAFLIIALGLPEVLPESTDEGIATSTSGNNSTIVEEAQQAVVEAILPLDAIDNSTDESINEVTDAATPAAAIETAGETISVEEQVASIFEPVTESMPEPSAQENWYAFWSPFRSELAANGFVSQLQKTTGMDYRVVRLKPGVYEVAFAYGGDEDIAAKLAAISTATGLEMPDG